MRQRKTTMYNPFLYMESFKKKKRFIDTEKKLVTPRDVWDDFFKKDNKLITC